MSKRSLAFGTIALAMLASMPVARAGDELPRQVLIQAKIVEVDRGFARDLGVRFGFETARGNAPADSPFSNDAPLFDPNASYASPWIGGLPLSDMTLDSRLSALEQEGQARILSAPKITTVDGKEASIEVGESIRDAQEDSGAASTVGGDLSLVFKPVISNDGMLEFELELLEGARMVPPLQQRTMETKVTMPDEATLVIGGLFQDPEPDADSSFPALGNLPYVGNLFRRDPPPERTQLLIFVTPTILREDQDGDDGGGGSGSSTTRRRPEGTKQPSTLRPRIDPRLN